MQWSKTCFVDELWTMTGNGQKIGASPSSTLPQYFGMVEVLKIAEEVDSLRTAPEMKEALSRLSEENRAAIIKRLEETRQLAVRGRDIIDAGNTEEYTDEILSLSYEMSKDGLREAVKGQIDGDIDAVFPGKVITQSDDTLVDRNVLIAKVGWFHSANGVVKELGGKEYGSFTEYLASKTKAGEFNAIQTVNKSQGNGSYREHAIQRKFAVLKSMGYDISRYNNWKSMEGDLVKAGFWVGTEKINQDFQDVFHGLKNDPVHFEKLCCGQAAMDASIQLILENVDFRGNDRNDHSMILFRTEGTNVVKARKVANIGQDKTAFRPGMCEAHGHINVTNIKFKNGITKALTVTRAPYSRIHALWFMERGKVDEKTGAYEGKKDFQFWAASQNEIDACTVGLPIIYVARVNPGDSVIEVGKSKVDIKEAITETLLDWEKKNSKKKGALNMNKIKLYPTKGTNEGDYVFFDAGSDIELHYDPWGFYNVRKGDVRLMTGSIVQGMIFGADLELVCDVSYFEGTPKDYDSRDVWCRDPRFLMCTALCSWVVGSIAWDDDEEETLEDDEWAKRIEEREAFENRALEDFNKLINPLPSMEEAKSFLKANGMLREDVVIDPDCFVSCEPSDFIDVPPKFQALVEKYKAR